MAQYNAGPPLQSKGFSGPTSGCASCRAGGAERPHQHFSSGLELQLFFPFNHHRAGSCSSSDDHSNGGSFRATGYRTNRSSGCGADPAPLQGLRAAFAAFNMPFFVDLAYVFLFGFVHLDYFATIRRAHSVGVTDAVERKIHCGSTLELPALFDGSNMARNDRSVELAGRYDRRSELVPYLVLLTADALAQPNRQLTSTSDPLRRSHC